MQLEAISVQNSWNSLKGESTYIWLICESEFSLFFLNVIFSFFSPINEKRLYVFQCWAFLVLAAFLKQTATKQLNEKATPRC